jgi:hypothetical protein
MLPLVLFNTTTITADGSFESETIDTAEARALAQKADELHSAVGHAATAEIMSTLLGVKVEASRPNYVQQVGQLALVLKLRSRIPEGKVLSAVEIEEIGYDFKLMVRTR